MTLTLIVLLTYELYFSLPIKCVSTISEVLCHAISTEIGTIDIPVLQIRTLSCRGMNILAQADTAGWRQRQIPKLALLTPHLATSSGLL